MSSRTSLMIGGLLVIAATLAGCSGSGGTGSYGNPASPTPTPIPTNPPAAADLTITIVGMNGSQSYSPNPATVKVGQTVAWRNADSIAHTATADAGGFNTGTVGAGATSSAITMTSAGSFSYHCQIHGFAMVGTLNVTP
jgi:plastocyanin